MAYPHYIHVKKCYYRSLTLLKFKTSNNINHTFINQNDRPGHPFVVADNVRVALDMWITHPHRHSAPSSSLTYVGKNPVVGVLLYFWIWCSILPHSLPDICFSPHGSVCNDEPYKINI